MCTNNSFYFLQSNERAICILLAETHSTHHNHVLIVYNIFYSCNFLLLPNYNPRQFLLGRLENKPGMLIAIFVGYGCLCLCLSFPPTPCSMLDSPRRIMRKNLQLKLNIDTGKGRNVKARQNLAIFIRVLAMIVLF